MSTEVYDAARKVAARRRVRLDAVSEIHDAVCGACTISRPCQTMVLIEAAAGLRFALDVVLAKHGHSDDLPCPPCDVGRNALARTTTTPARATGEREDAPL